MVASLITVARVIHRYEFEKLLRNDSTDPTVVDRGRILEYVVHSAYSSCNAGTYFDEASSKGVAGDRKSIWFREGPHRVTNRVPNYAAGAPSRANPPSVLDVRSASVNLACKGRPKLAVSVLSGGVRCSSSNGLWGGFAGQYDFGAF
jgi:hypothetical protein